ncbi:hypothetical protein LFM09_11005 [Lentzea alba]|uniref:hypothetical protein n=1 Tax=Lentzea alba TaxID=2714351 RepID=UPI0039BEEE5A
MSSQLEAAYAHGPGKHIEPGPTPRTPPAPGPRIPLQTLQGEFPAAVAQLLIDVMTPQRWEPWNQYNDHRAYPSPRAAYLVDVTLNNTLLDPARRALIGTAPKHLTRARLEITTHPERLSEGYGDFRDALAELEAGHVLAALTNHANRMGLNTKTDPEGITLQPGETTRIKTPPRTSGIGPRGLSADPRPLPNKAFHKFIAAIDHHLTHNLAVRNVEGVEDGWYRLNPLEHTLKDAMSEVQSTYGHPRTNTDVAGMNLALVMTADVRKGNYRNLLRQAGSTAQNVCEAAAEAGMFCRPVRSVEDQSLEAKAGAPASHSLLYVLLAGRQRTRCFPYDLTPLEQL